jgi:hypothetical protein
MRFRSKVDTWLIAVALIPMAIVIVLVPMSEPMILSLIPAAVTVLVVWILFSTWYEITPDTLIARSAFLRWTVPLDSITAMHETRNPLSAPAASLDRIAIHHHGGLLLVSPREKAAFMAAIQQRASRLSTDVHTARDADASTVLNRRYHVGWAILAIQVVVAGIVGVSVYVETRPPRVTLTEQRVAIRGGFWRHDVARAELVSVRLIDDMPRARRLAGFAAGSVLRGRFAVDTMGTGYVFVNKAVRPFVLIRESVGFTIVNFDDPLRTRALFEELMRYKGAQSAIANR